MAKRLMVEEVMAALRENASAEPEGDKIVYYLHVTADGEIVPFVQKADSTFTESVDLYEYFKVADDEEFEDKYDNDWGAACVEQEEDPDSDFASICESLAKQANAWLEGNE